MGIFSELKEIVDDLTGKTRLEELKQEIMIVQENFNEVVTRYNDSLSLYLEIKEKLNRKLNSCYDLINIYGLIDKRNKKIDMFAIEEEVIKNNYDLSKLPDSVTTPYIMAGGVTGVLVPYGMYCAVSTFGVASTGTAIATLSGAAATNATLAALGGGALGIGGGIALGTSLLATTGVGCFLIPIVIKSFKNNENSDKLEEEIKILNEKTVNIRKCVVVNNKILSKITETLSLIKNYKEEYNERMKKIVEKANKTTKLFTENLSDIKKTLENKNVDLLKIEEKK